MSPDFSVIIPTFNRPLATDAAVRSAIAAITYLAERTEYSAELLVIDDGSDPAYLLPQDVTAGLSEGSLGMVVRLIHCGENRGASAARNRGFAESQGRWIAHLDSDDAWTVERLYRAAQFIEAHDFSNEQLEVICCAVSSDRRGRRVVMTPQACHEPAHFACGITFNPGSAAVVSRAAYARLGIFDESLARLEDYDWYLRFGRAGGRLSVQPEVLVQVHPSRYAESEPVDRACAVLQERHSGLPWSRKVSAFLHLVRAAVRFQSARRLAAVWYLLRSFLLCPRFTLQLRPARVRGGAAVSTGS